MYSDDTILSVKDVSKLYKLYQKPHDRLLQMMFRGKKSFYNEFWALRDISFSMKKGESIGILGKNGAGKSTLLQIIAGTVAQSAGTVEKKGRIAALLELGSGFNPEFTGRENAYLNGSILGLSREEMDEALPKIEKFADIGDFFDRPVKIYSSGMMVRVAFAVQVQVKPNILIVDEALAVGDAVFQQKCARKMNELIASGVSLLFVSHDITAIASFCSMAMLLEHGKQVAFGTAKEVGELYLLKNKQELYVAAAAAVDAQACLGLSHQLLAGDAGANLTGLSSRIGEGGVRFMHAWLLDGQGTKALLEVPYDTEVRIRVRMQVNRDIERPVLCYRIDNLRGGHLTGSTMLHDGFASRSFKKHEVIDTDIVTTLPLLPGDYSICLYINQMNTDGSVCVLDGLETAALFKIAPSEKKLPIYQYNTKNEWEMADPDEDPARRSLTVMNNTDLQISVCDKEFIVPHHWFWEQFVGRWELDTFLIFQRFITPETPFVDIGSWVGPCILYAAALGASHTYSVEANPETCKLLHTAIERSETLTGKVTVFNCCIAPADGEYQFGLPDDNIATSSASSLRGSGFTVSGLPLLDFLQRESLENTPFIKIDIEGAEYDQADAFRSLAQRDAGYIFLSLHPPFWADKSRITEFLAAFSGFALFDAKMNPLSHEELAHRCTAETRFPYWGTIHGNFFEVLLGPKGSIL